MRSGMIKMLFVVVACGIMLPAGLWAQEDANIPWDPNTHLAPYPHVCALSTEYYIPEHGEVAWTSFDRRIKLSGKIGVTDPNRLIGLSENPDDILAWDAIGTPLDSASGEQGALIYTPLKYAATIWVPSERSSMTLRARSRKTVVFLSTLADLTTADLRAPWRAGVVE